MGILGCASGLTGNGMEPPLDLDLDPFLPHLEDFHHHNLTSHFLPYVAFQKILKRHNTNRLVSEEDTKMREKGKGRKKEKEKATNQVKAGQEKKRKENKKKQMQFAPWGEK